MTSIVIPKPPDFPERLDLTPSGAPKKANNKQANGRENFLLISTSAPAVGSPFFLSLIIFSFIFSRDSSLFPANAFLSSFSVSGSLRVMS